MSLEAHTSTRESTPNGHRSTCDVNVVDADSHKGAQDTLLLLDLWTDDWSDMVRSRRFTTLSVSHGQGQIDHCVASHSWRGARIILY